MPTLEDLEATIEDLTMTIKTLGGELDTLKSEIAEMQVREAGKGGRVRNFWLLGVTF